MTDAEHAPAPGGRVERWLRCRHAWIDDEVVDDVLVGLAGDRIVAVERGGPGPPASGGRAADGPTAAGRGAGGPAADGPTTAARGRSVPVERLDGLVLPGLVDAHSHCFHRALRGRTHGDGGTFWTWRERMYAVARTLDPDALRGLAVAVLAEQAEAGVTTIGEFHYLHHRPDGSPYAEPNALGLAVLDAAAEVGLRVTLLDTLYLTGGLGRTTADPGLDEVQRRFSDGTVGAWATRVAALAERAADDPLAHLGAALHSVRAVPPDALAAAAAVVADVLAPAVAGDRTAVVHAHVAEQAREVADARDVHGRTPVGLLDAAGVLDAAARVTAVHGVWLDDEDVATLARAEAVVCACPTTERDLADGVVAGDVLHAAGVGLALGSDQHVATDLFEEARTLELHRRLVTLRRGGLDATTLLAAATRGGARSLGWDGAGAIAPGALADLCVVDLGSARLAGVDDDRLVDGVVFAATADDVVATMVGGRWVARDGRHVRLDVPRALAAAVRRATGGVPR